MLTLLFSTYVRTLVPRTSFAHATASTTVSCLPFLSDALLLLLLLRSHMYVLEAEVVVVKKTSCSLNLKAVFLRPPASYEVLRRPQTFSMKLHEFCLTT